MVSPPLPMTSPALPAGIMISWTVPFCPLALSWNCPGGPPRPRDTMSSRSSFAFLRGGGGGGGWSAGGVVGGVNVDLGGWEGWGDVVPTHCTASGDPVSETLRSGNPPLSAGRGGTAGGGGAAEGQPLPPAPPERESGRAPDSDWGGKWGS